MRKFLSYVILIPLGAIFVAFAVANRHFVRVSFDPFNAADPSLAVSLPLFALIIAAAIAGVVAGGCATWVGQRHWRRAARRHEADARSARAALANLRPGETMPRTETERLAPPPAGGFYGASGRDKRGAAL